MLSNRSSDARVLNRASATQLPNGSWIQWMCAGFGVMQQARVDQPLVVAVARPEHHAVVAERDRPAIAVGGDVADGQDGHGLLVWRGRAAKGEKHVLIYRNAAGGIMDFAAAN